MKVVYFYRNITLGYSIQKVFSTISKEVAKKNEVQEIYLPCADANPLSLIKNLIYVFNNRNKNGINHITGDIHYCILALIGCKSVLTIHDLVFIKNSKNRFDRWIKFVFWLYFPVKMADRVVCISEKTKEDVLQYVKVNNISVISNPVDSKFQYHPKIFNENKPVILHIGTGWNKNLNRTIEALENISCHLRIIGKLNGAQSLLLANKHISYSNACSLNDKEIIEEYENCDIVSFSSVYEGFGMPIIEGQAIGRVVLTSRRSPMKEVAGKGAFLIEPEDTLSIHNGFIELMNNADLRRNIIKNGLENVKQHQLETIVAQYLYLYRNI